jgi:phosphate-selective porin OprO/OprP
MPATPFRRLRQRAAARSICARVAAVRRRARIAALVPGCGILLAAALWPQPAAAVTMYDYDSEHGRQELRVYADAQQDFLPYSDVPDDVTTRTARLRRAWLGLRLRVHDDWIARVSGDFARRPALRDFSLEYRGWPARIQIGRFPEPFSMGGSISFTDTLQMNRPSPVLLGPDYGFGIGTSLRGRNWGLAAGAFTRNVSPTLSSRYPQNALTLRATWRPVNGEAGFLHVGVSASERQMRQGTGVLLSGTAESNLVSGLTPHGPLLSDKDLYRLLGGEAAVRWQSALLLSEYIRAHVAGGPDWSGEYVEAAWAVTGERRPYSTRYGVVGGISPNRPLSYGGIGAWELAVRWSRTDLRDGGGNLGWTQSAGLNWYPEDPLRISLSAGRTHLQFADGGSRSGTLVQLRLQLSF